ncbi:hypothetical protein [Lysobacter panacisoli]|uniref:DUF3325 domain-containing protein n=1 Tax=Lysobacter panacisoli TaxID=1255263 RepID=A0ABP9KXM6_9GAMM|nr:hypothetical protein [Lysobacter panacisoli]
MSLLVAIAAATTAMLSAAAFYAASEHCRWPAWKRRGARGRVVGSALAVASLALWIAQLGVGAGLCAMMGSWMLVVIALPYIAWRTAPADGSAR